MNRHMAGVEGGNGCADNDREDSEEGSREQPPAGSVKEEMSKQTLRNGAVALFVASVWAMFLAFMVASTVSGASSVADAAGRSLVAVLLVAGAAFGFWASFAVSGEELVVRTKSLVPVPVRATSQPRARRPRR